MLVENFSILVCVGIQEAVFLLAEVLLQWFGLENQFCPINAEFPQIFLVQGKNSVSASFTTQSCPVWFLFVIFCLVGLSLY